MTAGQEQIQTSHKGCLGQPRILKEEKKGVQLASMSNVIRHFLKVILATFLLKWVSPQPARHAIQLEELGIQLRVSPVLLCRSVQPDQLLQGVLPAPLDHSLHLGLLPVILMVVRVSEMSVSLPAPSHPLSALLQPAAISFLLLSAF